MSGGFNPIQAFNPLSLLATAALGPLGGIVAQIAQQLVSRVVEEALQQVGQQLGIPQFGIDMLQSSFAGAMGDTAGAIRNANESSQSLLQGVLGAIGATPQQAGQAERATEDLRTQVENITRQGAQQADEAEGEDSRGSNSWVRALVKALGPKLDSLAGEMKELAGAAEESPSKAMEFQAASQEFNLLMNTLTTAIKAVGEAQATAARKQ